MKKSVSVGVLLSAVVCLAYGCGGDDDTTSSPHAGSAGKGAEGGKKGGAGGSAGKGGKAGQGGSSGRGGTAGAPRGGSSGHGGTAGASGAGQGGQCDAEPQGPLAECPPFPTPDGDQRTVSTTCSFEDTCRELDCGGTWSQFDASGCRRPTCTASSQCDDDERCIASLLVGESGCYASVFEGCELLDCSCTCIVSEDCQTIAFCQPAADFPQAADCPLSTVDCSGLPYFITQLELWTQGIDTEDPSDLDTAMLACQTKATEKLAQCNGHGGEGGGGAGGQSGGGAGGQSGGGVGGQ